MTSSSLDARLLSALVCPETQQSVALASAELVAQLNAKSHAGSLKTHAGNMVHGDVEHALLRADGKCAYLVVDGVPNMLVDERIDL